MSAFDVDGALALCAPGSRVVAELLVEVSPEKYVRTAAILQPGGHMLIPVDARLDDGGYVQMMIRMDEVTYERAMKIAHQLGGVPVLRNMLQQSSTTADFRPLLPR